MTWSRTCSRVLDLLMSCRQILGKQRLRPVLCEKNGRPGRRCSLAIGYGLASKKASDNAELPARAWRAAESPISFSK